MNTRECCTQNRRQKDARDGDAPHGCPAMAPSKRAQRAAATPGRPEGVRSKTRRARGADVGVADAGDDRERGRDGRGRGAESNEGGTPRAPATCAGDTVNAAPSARDDVDDGENDASDERQAEGRREGVAMGTPSAGRALARNPQTGRFGPPIRAPPLLAEDVGRLGKDDRRRVLARWSGRLRGLKKRALELSGQFPTSNICVYFTKPFATESRAGMWCVRARIVVVVFVAFGRFVACATDWHFVPFRSFFFCADRAEEELFLSGPFRRRELETPGEGTLSGAQVIRRALGDTVGLRLLDDDRHRDALPHGSLSSSERAVAERAVLDSGALDELFTAIQDHVSAHSRGAVAHAFAQSQVARHCAPVRGGEIEQAAAAHVDARRRERDSAVAAAFDDAKRLVAPNSSA